VPDTTLPVFLAASVPASGSTVLDGEEARHAATVRRLRAGERLVLSDGAGTMARCVVDAVQPGRDALLTLTVEESWTEAPPALRVHLAQALAKGDRGELAVELATEAGADAIVPWRATRSVAKWEDGPRGEKALARWRATARAAAKQARRAHIPDVTEPVTTGELAGLAETMSLTIIRLFISCTRIIGTTTGGLAPDASKGCHVPARVQPTLRAFDLGRGTAVSGSPACPGFHFLCLCCAG